MILGGELSERLTHLMTATAICCATATVAPGARHRPGDRRARHCRGGARRCRGHAVFVAAPRDGRPGRTAPLAREIDDGSDAWIDDEFRGLPDAAANRDAAIAAIWQVLPLIRPTPEELVRCTV
jgi:hypothetical protein